MNVRQATMDDIPELMRLAGQWLNPLYDKEKKEDTLFEEIAFPEYRATHPIFIIEKDQYDIPIRDIGYVDILINLDTVNEYKQRYQENEEVDDIIIEEIKGQKEIEEYVKSQNWDINLLRGGNKYVIIDGRHRMLAKIALGEKFIRSGIIKSDHSPPQIIGFCDCWWHQDWLTNKLRLTILHVYIDTNYRKLGIGTFLLKEVLRQTNPDFVFVDTKPDKFPYAEKLYKKIGFEENPRRKWLEVYL